MRAAWSGRCASESGPTRARRRSIDEADFVVDGTEGVRELLTLLSGE